MMEKRLQFSFVFLDKPKGPSSHEVTSYVKKLLGIKKTGHAGTLDPQVSGVLIVATGKAARLLQYVAAKEKTYVGVLRTREAPQDLYRLQSEMNKWLGRISQVPPRESAVAKRKRERKVFEFTALELEGNTALFRARVEAGTYVRVMCQDVGRAFGGGKMIELRRTAVGNVGENQLCTITDLQDAVYLWREKGDGSALSRLLHPAEDYINIPRVILTESSAEAVGRGAPLAQTGVASAEGDLMKGKDVQMRRQDGSFVGIAEWIGEGGIAALPKKIIRLEKMTITNTDAGIA